MSKNSIELNPKFIIYALLILGAALLAWEIRGVLLMLFVAYILNAGLRPLVDELERRRVPRGIAISVIYLLVFLFLGLLGFIIAGELVHQLTGLINSLPEIYGRVVNVLRESFPFLANLLPLDSLKGEIVNFASTVINSTWARDLVTGENLLAIISQTYGVFGSIAGMLVTIFTIIMVSVYMLIRKNRVYEGVITLLPDDIEKRARKILEKIEASLGSWLIGQVSLMFIIALVSYIVVWVPGMLQVPGYTLHEYALPIAITAGLLEALPNIGPILTSLLTMLIALGTSGLGSVVYVFIAFAAIQNLEAIFIVPKVMQRAVGIDPIVTILAIIAAFQLGGVVGALLSIPIVAVAQITLVELAREYKKLERQRPKLV